MVVSGSIRPHDSGTTELHVGKSILSCMYLGSSALSDDVPSVAWVGEAGVEAKGRICPPAEMPLRNERGQHLGVKPDGGIVKPDPGFPALVLRSRRSRSAGGAARAGDIALT